MKNQAFLAFCKKILAGEEGFFWSEQRNAGETDWRSGYGKKQSVDFDNVDECVFVTDFLGKESFVWKFKHDFSELEEEIDEGVLESMALEIELRKTESQADFLTKIEAIKELAQAGELWVLNFSYKNIVQKLHLIQLLSAFCKLLKSKKNHAGGIVWTKELKFVSFSPEVFIHHKDKRVSTFPVKGTGDKVYLETSEKEISELAMVTDLLRNDLGQIADRVWVQEERKITAHSGFYQAHAEIVAELPTSELSFAQYQQLLPAGSITGAPKKRVTDYILDLESTPRNFYTGTFGVKKSRTELVSNILIRTFFYEDNQWVFPVGVGVTHMSDAVAEWDECHQKFAAVMNFFSKT